MASNYGDRDKISLLQSIITFLHLFRRDVIRIAFAEKKPKITWEIPVDVSGKALVCIYIHVNGKVYIGSKPSILFFLYWKILEHFNVFISVKLKHYFSFNLGRGT